MRYRLYQEPDYHVESMQLLDDIINRSSLETTRDEMIEKYGGMHAADITKIFAESIALKEYAEQNISYDFDGFAFNGYETAEFLYKHRESTDNYLASVFYFYSLFNRTEIDKKLLAIIAYANEAYFENLELDKSPVSVNSDAELFKLFDSFDLNAAEKYELMKLYYYFDEYNAYHTRLIHQVTRMIKDKLPCFTSAIETSLKRLDNELQHSGILFFKEQFGVEINDDVAYNVHPLIYQVNSLGFHGSVLTDYQINFGTGVLPIIDIKQTAKPFTDTLPEFLKMLSDPTKMAILRMLRDEPCYGGQIAEKLSLTGATISYHMTALKRLDLIYIKKISAKVYYSLNNEKIRRLLDGLTETLVVLP